MWRKDRRPSSDTRGRKTKHCGECEKCPCQDSDRSQHCRACQYCQFCYMCPILCETACQPGSIMDQLSGALVQSVSSIFDHEEQ
nr:sarcoplasmic reticulum histidine-rich calcium-binding protein-like [Pelodiscus sinensis]|eukprot:XP_025043337.1 sarcoplasmic reticulum histidine-rich calcium-binding protein-like [Pelodiscus sinensis]